MMRIKELDYLKGVLILLVISFHLVWFEQLHPFAKQVVYSFHMPGFLLISGYLMNVSKAPKDFLRTLLWIAVPYIVMESGYIVMASLLPIGEHIDRLTPMVFLDRLCLHPLGPYWYLHTLILCGGLYYYIYNNVQRGPTTRFLLIGIACYILARAFGILSFSSALYFLAGAAIRQSGIGFLTFFRPSHFSLLAFVLLVSFSDNPNQASIGGVLIAYTAISSLLYAAPSPDEGKKRRMGSLPPRGEVWRGAVFLGRNSLPLYIFSPIFTFLCKQLVPFLQFDKTGLLFLLVSLIFCVSGCLLIAWLMDIIGISRFFFGRKALSI